MISATKFLQLYVNMFDHLTNEQRVTCVAHFHSRYFWFSDRQVSLAYELD